MLVEARCSMSLSEEISQEKLSFQGNGDGVANVCCSNFVGTGLKENNNTKLLMQHVPKKFSNS